MGLKPEEPPKECKKSLGSAILVVSATLFSWLPLLKMKITEPLQ
jgi:hypothetical protein